MEPTSTKHGTNLAQGGGSKGYPKTNMSITEEKSKEKNQHKKKRFVFKMWSEFLKIRNVQRLDVYRGIMKKKKVINILYKTNQKENQGKSKMSNSPSTK